MMGEPPAVLEVSAEDLRRVLVALDTAASLDGDLLSMSQERAFSSLRHTMKEAGHRV